MSAAETSRSMQFLYDARVTHWTYPRDITPAQAEDHARSLLRSGINVVLTEGHRSLVNDWPTKPEDIEQTAREGGAETSVRATRVVVDACHAVGIKVLHHVTSTFCTKAYIDAHPDWAQLDARTGEPLFFSMYGGLWLLCPNNPDFRENYFRLAADFTRRTGIDGWMVDEVEILPHWYSCGCRHCREKLRQETGFALPEGKESPVWENFEDATWRAWLRFRMKSCGDFFVDLKKALDTAAPGQVLTGCVAGASEMFLTQYWGMDAAEIGRAANFPFYEAYIPAGSQFYSWRRFMAEMLLYSSIARPHGTPALTLFYPTSVQEIPICWAMCSVAGNRYWKLAHGMPASKPFHADDDADFFAWEKEHASAFAPQSEVADIALLFSKQTRDATPTSGGVSMERLANTPRNELGSRDLNNYVNEWAGWAEALIDSNAPFAVIRDVELTDTGLRPYKVLVLPDAQCLSDEQAAAVLAFAKRGGRLVTTGKPAARTHTGERRSMLDLSNQIRAAATHLDGKPGSRSLLGFVFAGKLLNDTRDAAALAEIRKALSDALPSPEWGVDGPGGVIGRAYRQTDGNVVFHVVNFSGTFDDLGTTLPETGKIQPKFPLVQNVRLRLRADTAPSEPKACWITPEPAETTVPLERRGDYFEAAIPPFTFYGVLRVTRHTQSNTRYTVERRQHNNESLYVLRDTTTGASATFWPAFGFQCLALVLTAPDVRPVALIDDLQTTDELREFPTRYGSPILYPWPSRIPTGEYSFSGRVYNGREPHARAAQHGLVKNRAWTVVSSSADDAGAELVCSISTSDHPEMLDSFPFPNRLTVAYRLSERGLTASVKVENLGSSAMPFGFGFHPYLRIPFAVGGKREDCRLEIEAASQWNFSAVMAVSPDDANRDIGEFKKPNEFARVHPLGTADYDHGFTSLALAEGKMQARVIDPAAGLAVTVQASRDFQTLVLYTPPGRNAVCLEPWTCPPNAFNLAAAGVEGSGLKILQAGETWSGEMRLWIEAAQ